MSRWLRNGLMLVALLIWMSPAQALAYSYGDANTEDVAETFKVIVSAVNENDWTAAEEAYKVRRSEIKSHFGEAVALTLDKNMEEKASKLLIANYKAVLVMNLDRRFTYAQKDLSDYAGTKLLLAKAKATFDTLSPYISSGTDQINQAFEEALEALGNPGLFGVGKKDADPDTFKQKVNFIYGKVNPQFPYKAYVKPAAPAPGKDKPVTKPSSTPKPSPGKEPSAAAKPEPSGQPKAPEAVKGADSAAAGAAASSKPKNEDAEASVDKPKEEAEAPVTEATTPEESSAEVVTAEPGTDAAAGQEEAVAEDKPTAEESPPADTNASEVSAGSDETSEGAQSEKAASDSQAAAAEAEGHAPMERTDRTNTSVTIFVVAGVILLGGGGLYFARKKGLL
ncbi:LPXTG cell wall anchor domain-containing protein [Paenibacillus oenotherae]|uniref:LPXTG cell wall anchor domain-containing protein n=1 Tax=Paenibacillus oenotherae TaxID=1435645 RepID=A0ABS7DAU7_9BACL|nr:LPXTG cell wall anchor domain-containing protein [Paenibacillus oenotherae]MBW7476878.1 LPXTG cell wall anchor domain-containing protein [Paenibacillus oenotherae]